MRRAWSRRFGGATDRGSRNAGCDARGKKGSGPAHGVPAVCDPRGAVGRADGDVGCGGGKRSRPGAGTEAEDPTARRSPAAAPNARSPWLRHAVTRGCLSLANAGSLLRSTACGRRVRHSLPVPPCGRNGSPPSSGASAETSDSSTGSPGSEDPDRVRRRPSSPPAAPRSLFRMANATVATSRIEAHSQDVTWGVRAQAVPQKRVV